MIAAPAEARLIVDAGPGTGKTATAAGRIAALAEKGIPPAHIWTISFSRAAVAEMRARLLSLGGGQTAPGHVTTLDSSPGSCAPMAKTMAWCWKATTRRSKKR